MADWWWKGGWSSPKIEPVARQMVSAKSAAGGADSTKPWRARRRLGARADRGPRWVSKKWRAVDRMEEGAGGRVGGVVGLGRSSAGLSGGSQGEESTLESGDLGLTWDVKLVVLSGLPHDDGLACCVDGGGD